MVRRREAPSRTIGRPSFETRPSAAPQDEGKESLVCVARCRLMKIPALRHDLGGVLDGGHVLQSRLVLRHLHE